MAGAVLWEIRGDGSLIRLFGGGPALPDPWSDPQIEALVTGSDVFWCEVPKLEGDVQALAIKHGVTPGAPLETWLNEADLARVGPAAEAVGVNPELLKPLRPWLAAQILKMASETHFGFQGKYSAEQHLEAVAKEAGIPVRSEFPAGEELFAMFASWPRQVEIERLLSVLDDITVGPEAIREQQEAWLDIDLGIAEKIDQRYRRDYPALYDHLIVGRNQAWVERIQTMLSEDKTVFILVGTGHLVGPHSVPALLERAGIRARRV